MADKGILFIYVLYREQGTARGFGETDCRDSARSVSFRLKRTSDTVGPLITAGTDWKAGPLPGQNP